MLSSPVTLTVRAFPSTLFLSFPLLTAGPFLPLLLDRGASCVVHTVEIHLRNEERLAFLDPLSGGLYLKLVVVLPKSLVSSLRYGDMSYQEPIWLLTGNVTFMLSPSR